MKRGKGIILSSLLVLTLFGVLSCAPKVTQQDFDRVSTELNQTKNELGATRSQITSLQSKLAEAEKMQTQYKDLVLSYEDLRKQSDATKSELAKMQMQYQDLSTKRDDLKRQYDDLKKQYDAISGAVPFSLTDVEQAIFKQINKERLNNGLAELAWGENLHFWAELNNRAMAQTKKVQSSEYPSWQEVFWAAGYTTAEQIANGALITWKNDADRYKLNFLNKSSTYGTVAVQKSGELFYITYIAHIFR